MDFSVGQTLALAQTTGKLAARTRLLSGRRFENRILHWVSVGRFHHIVVTLRQSRYLGQPT